MYVSNNCEISYEELPDDPMLIKITPVGWVRPTSYGGENSEDESQRRQLTVEDHLELE